MLGKSKSSNSYYIQVKTSKLKKKFEHKFYRIAIFFFFFPNQNYNLYYKCVLILWDRDLIR